MRTNAIIAGLLFLIVLFAGCATEKINRVCFKENCFDVEVVNDKTSREKGLMYREKLDEDKGMLFVFERDGVYPFWMKNTLIPLDMIWIDSSGHVVYIYRNAQPCGQGNCPNIDPGVSARYVLEVNSGAVDRIGLKEGELLSMPPI